MPGVTKTSYPAATRLGAAATRQGSPSDTLRPVSEDGRTAGPTYGSLLAGPPVVSAPAAPGEFAAANAAAYSPVPPPKAYPVVRAQNEVPYGPPAYSVPSGPGAGFEPPGAAPNGFGGAPGPGENGAPANAGVFAQPPPGFNPPPLIQDPLVGAPGNYADIEAMVDETRTGRFMFGVGVNSDAGVTGQITIDERNFDWRRVPGGWQDVTNGSAFRGAGQGFRIEAMPGNRVQRYMVNFTEPYLFDTPVSFNINGFFYDRLFYDWNEQRFGGRVALGYRLSPDLSASVAVRAESIDIFEPRVLGVPELDAVLGKSQFYSGRLTLTYDTRDIPFAPTEGALIELAAEQAWGTFEFPRAEIDLRRYYMIYERPDGSGRHTLAFIGRYGVSGTETPIYENFFAGGFSTLRGFAFRGASPIDGGVIVGGRSRLLASAEYMYPITADDMIKGVIFCDAGTVERDLSIRAENFRVAPGFGLRINIPALGPAPLALDFAFPVAQAAGDNEQIFSFFFGVGR